LCQQNESSDEVSKATLKQCSKSGKVNFAVSGQHVHDDDDSDADSLPTKLTATAKTHFKDMLRVQPHVHPIQVLKFLDTYHNIKLQGDRKAVSRVISNFLYHQRKKNKSDLVADVEAFLGECLAAVEATPEKPIIIGHWRGR
jgi:hypothetical protein